jgi:hypothetical protein
MQLAGGGMPTSAPFFVGVRWHGTCKQHFLVASHGWSFDKVSERFALAIPFCLGITFRAAFDQPYRLRLA